ncbi:YqgE/AlgH family protein [Pseudoflavitalea sp. G-6-1-2]|uniref:YqgE/AlgH family protein n=1 Tax=Pseudoflavitalea sp. G-6-1-2 TaxID=2728841 RepID=UPI00146F54FB|nr:YqgE/AlgH family protein [Pseudoflavitalea sp. G-6-1-2]NML23108.1 YqgE/AlgH family protein [Pseudoflavitalea sp. G-6-1-2]
MQGIFLNSTDLLKDTFFENTQIFITEYNENGAMGFVVNELFPYKFNELEEFKHSAPFPMYDGGPMDRESLFFIHQRPDLITGGTLVTGNIYLGGDFEEAVRLINNKTLSEKDIKLLIGYCGWDHQDLEEEIVEGSWEVSKEGQLFGE